MEAKATTQEAFVGPAARYGLPGCPNCGPVELYPVYDGELTNLYCDLCGGCWHVELGFVMPIPRATCPGCQVELQCRERHGTHS